MVNNMIESIDSIYIPVNIDVGKFIRELGLYPADYKGVFALSLGENNRLGVLADIPEVFPRKNYLFGLIKGRQYKVFLGYFKFKLEQIEKDTFDGELKWVFYWYGDRKEIKDVVINMCEKLEEYYAMNIAIILCNEQVRRETLESEWSLYDW
jgi:hypothetical protein